MLLYSSTMDFDDRPLYEFTLADSPVTCIQKAIENHHDIIIIFYHFKSLKERFATVELCAKLKKHPHSRHVPLLCLFPSKHRGLLEQLREIKVEYARFYEPGTLNSKRYMDSLLAKPTKDCKIDRILCAICPHINYVPISRHQEIMYCRAYRNRLVLGSNRLIHSCETLNHKKCQYFKCPQFL